MAHHKTLDKRKLNKIGIFLLPHSPAVEIQEFVIARACAGTPEQAVVCSAR
jgi:hypothetical protein